jgi:hypothetical protein
MNFHYELAILVKACDIFLSVEKSTNCNLNLKKKKKKKEKKEEERFVSVHIRYTVYRIIYFSDLGFPQESSGSSAFRGSMRVTCRYHQNGLYCDSDAGTPSRALL